MRHIAYNWTLKVEKSQPQKKYDFRDGSNWVHFCCLNFGGCKLWIQLSQAFHHQFWFFFGLLLTWLQISWNFWNFPNIEFVWFWRMLWTKPPKIEISHRNRANPEIWPFLKMRFFNFFVNHMPQKYKDENRPYSILNGQKKPKHQEKSGKKWGI